MCSSYQWKAERCALMGLLFHLHQQAKMPFDANKLYCSEVLAILLQNNDGETCLWCRYAVRVGSSLLSDHNSTLWCSASLCLCSVSPCVCSLTYACTLPFSAAFVLCQAILILFADVSVLDGCKIWQLASFFSLFSPFPHFRLDNRELLGELDGIDVLLQQLSVSNSHTPSLPSGDLQAGCEEVEQILGVALS